MEKLSDELRLMILESLPSIDVRNMTMVSRDWFRCATDYIRNIYVKNLELTDHQLVELLSVKNDLNQPKRYDAIKLSSVSWDNAKRFFSPFGCYLTTLFIQNSSFTFYALVDTLQKMDHLQKLILKRNTWLPDNCVNLRIKSRSLKSIQLIVLEDNFKKRLSAVDFEFLLALYQAIETLNIVGRILDFPMEPYYDNQYWNVEELRIHFVEVRPFKILLKNVSFFQRAKVLHLCNNMFFFRQCQTHIISLIQKGFWQKIVFEYDENIYPPIELSNEWDNVISTQVTCIKNSVYLFGEQSLLGFPKLKEYSTYCGSLMPYEKKSPTSIIKLVVSEMDFGCSAKFATSIAFQNVIDLTLFEVSSYHYILPHVFANMFQLEKLKIKGNLQAHWVEDVELTGCSSAQKNKIIKSDDWGLLQNISLFRQSEEMENFGLRYLKNLKQLLFHDTAHILTDFSLLYGICQLHNLEYLYIPSAQITNFGLSSLKALTKLKTLNVLNCKLITTELCTSLMEENVLLSITYE